MKVLPADIISKIMLYSSTPEADLIKAYWRKFDKDLNIFYRIDGFESDDDLHYWFVPLDYPRAFFRRQALTLDINSDVDFIKYTTEFRNLPRLSY